MSEEQHRGFINWVHRFETLSREVRILDDLSDSIALFEICADVDPQWFKQIRSTDIGDNWVLKFNNLKKLHRLIVRYYEEVLGYPTVRLEAPNLNAIAKESDHMELLKLCNLVLTLAVQCEKNEKYIGMIMQLDESDQRALMVAIEGVMQHLGNTGESNIESINEDEDEDPMMRLQSDLMQLLAEKEDMEKAQLELKDEYDHLTKQYDNLMEIHSETKARVKQLEESIAQSEKSGKADFLMRAEIDSLKRDLDKSELKHHEVEKLLAEQLALVSDLKRKVESHNKLVEEHSRLRDQLQEYKHTAERLSKSENVIEKYKKKLEESADLRRQVRSLEDQVNSLQAQKQQVEDEYRKRLQIRSMADPSRDIVSELEIRNQQLEEELIALNSRVKELEDSNKTLSEECTINVEHIAELESSLRDMELRDSANAFDESLGRGLASFMDEDPIQLKNKIAELEKQLKGVEVKHAESHRKELGFLENLVEEVNQEKTKLEELYSAAKNAHEAETAANDELKKTESQLRNHTQELEQQLIDLRSKHALTNKTLEQTKRDLERSKADLAAVVHEERNALEAYKQATMRELDNLKIEKENLETWYNTLEDEKEKQSKRIEKLLSEKDELHKENRQLQRQVEFLEDHSKEMEVQVQELKTKLQGLQGQPTSADYQAIQAELRKSREEVHTLQIGIKKAKEYIKCQDKKLAEKADAKSQASSENFHEAIRSLKSQISAKEEQLEAMKKILREAHHHHTLEIQSMTSAWWHLQRQVERRSGFGLGSSGAISVPAGAKSPSSPVSWLAQQRNTLSMQRSKRR